MRQLCIYHINLWKKKNHIKVYQEITNPYRPTVWSLYHGRDHTFSLSREIAVLKGHLQHWNPNFLECLKWDIYKTLISYISLNYYPNKKNHVVRNIMRFRFYLCNFYFFKDINKRYQSNELQDS